MTTLNREELKKIAEEYNIKTMDDLEWFITYLEKEMVEAILEGEMYSYIKYTRYDRENKKTDYSRNRYTSKEVHSKANEFRINVPRDRDSSFEPKLVNKREKDVSNTEDIILLFYQKWLSTRDIQDYLLEVYNWEVSPETISNITNRVIEKAKEW